MGDSLPRCKECQSYLEKTSGKVDLEMDCLDFVSKRCVMREDNNVPRCLFTHEMRHIFPHMNEWGRKIHQLPSITENVLPSELWR